MKNLLVILGPTGVGKTEWAIKSTLKLKSSIVSADSRQLYRGLEIGTAAPDKYERSLVDHHMVGILSVKEYYSASRYEQEALNIIQSLHKEKDTVVLTGGSMMYIDAVCNGIDDIPNIDEKLRKDLQDLYDTEGLDPIRMQLKQLDPVFYNKVDLKNPKRVLHALEVCLMTGKPYSSLRTERRKSRPFNIVKIGLNRDRDELYERIDRRVDKMVTDGLIDEARKVYPFRHYNSLNTVGYKELFLYFDGEWTLDFALDKIKQHSRNYARRQMTWFKRDKDITWFDLSKSTDCLVDDIISLLP